MGWPQVGKRVFPQSSRHIWEGEAGEGKKRCGIIVLELIASFTVPIRHAGFCVPRYIHFYLNIVSYITACKWRSLSFCHGRRSAAVSLAWPLPSEGISPWPVALTSGTEVFNNRRRILFS